MRRLWPRRVAHQLCLLLIVALLTSHFIAVLFLQRTGSLLHPLSRAMLLDRLATAHHLVDPSGPSSQDQLMAAISNERGRFWLSSVPEVHPFKMDPEETRLSQELSARLNVPASRIHMQLERVTGAPARENFFNPTGWAPLHLRSSISLSSGMTLNSVQSASGAYEWRRLLTYSMPVSIMPIALILLFFIARVVKPFRVLAAATERISRGEWVGPLSASGPQEAQELTASFNQMQVRLARHVEGRTRMLAALSHDLNTPITELRLLVDLVEDGALHGDMLDSLKELSAMVDGTLRFIRDESAQEPVSTLSITTLLDDLARRYTLLGTPIDWPGAPPFEYRCRPLAIKRALTNLLDNALHYAGDAALRFEWTAQALRIEILDHGPGIDPDLIEQVFEPFVQAKSGKGVGLGLTIARACIQAHGGELRLENRIPRGLRAVVMLPLTA